MIVDMRQILRRLRGTAFAAILTLGTIAFPAQKGGASTPLNPIEVGNHFPRLEFQSLTGQAVVLDWSLRPQATLIFFFESRCAECFKEMAFMESISQRVRDLGLAIYAVEGSGKEAAEIETTLQNYRRLYSGPSYPIVADPEYRISAQLQVQRLPTTFLVESHGVVLSRHDRFENRDAVDLTRKIELLTRTESGTLSYALKGLGMSEQEEKTLERSLTAVKGGVAGEDRNSTPLLRQETVPSFEFTNLAGITRMWKPLTEGDGVTVVFFWGALCLPCIREMVYLQELHGVAKEFGLDILAVEASGLNPERTVQVMEQYRKFYPMPAYEIVPDPDNRIGQIFGVQQRIPQTFFLDREGKIIYHTEEFIEGEEKDLTRRIELALKIEAGSLEGRRSGSASPLPAGEAPSVMREKSEEQAFRSRILQGDMHYDSWEFDQALPYYLEALDLQPQNITILEKAARIYERRGDKARALEHWEHVLRINPDHTYAAARIRVLRGVVLAP